MTGKDMIIMSIREVKRLMLIQSAIDEQITQKSDFCFTRTFLNWLDSYQDFLDMQDRTSYTSQRKKGSSYQSKTPWIA
jgi:hypothetical protein